MNILVSGGAGYIGSHTVVELLHRGDNVCIVDDLSNSSEAVVDRIEQITGRRASLHVHDLRDEAALNEVFVDFQPEAVIHFAGLKAVGESVEHPLKYYGVNLDSTMALLRVMNKHMVKKIVFSSSATVYGSAPSPYEESQEIGHGVASPYGQTKYMIEQILKDLAASDHDWCIGTLRYFNPVGAHPSGLIGEQPSGVPNNLMPYITQVATGQRPQLQIFGNDYDTPDGTGVRDYIHVVDLAEGHLAMLDNLQPGYEPFNLGSGHGTSVLELVQAFERVNGITIPYVISPRRDGDLASYFANASKAEATLQWKATRTTDDMVRDSWNWQQQNPHGYE